MFHYVRTNLDEIRLMDRVRDNLTVININLGCLYHLRWWTLFSWTSQTCPQTWRPPWFNLEWTWSKPFCPCCTKTQAPRWSYVLYSTRLPRPSWGRPRSSRRRWRMVQACTLSASPRAIPRVHCYGAPVCRPWCCARGSSSSWYRGCWRCRSCWGRARLVCYSMALGSLHLWCPWCSPALIAAWLTSGPPFWIVWVTQPALQL